MIYLLIISNFASWTKFCQSNRSLNINKYVKNLLLRTSLCFFLNLDQTTAVIISGLSRSIIIKKSGFCPLVSLISSFKRGGHNIQRPIKPEQNPKLYETG